MAKLTLADGDKVVAVGPEYASGPGWSNEPLFVIVQDRLGGLRMECIQPEERSLEMHTLFSICAAASSAMIRVVEASAKRVKS